MGTNIHNDDVSYIAAMYNFTFMNLAQKIYILTSEYTAEDKIIAIQTLK